MRLWKSPRTYLSSAFLAALVVSLPVSAMTPSSPGGCGAAILRERFATHFPREPLAPTEMHYRWAGAPSGPVLVLLHGLDAASVTFDNVLDTLGERYRLLLVDLRGHGKTPAVGLDYWPVTLAEDVLALTRHLGVAEFHLLGHSFGARVAIRLVERAPAGTVRSLIVEDMSFEKRVDLDEAMAENVVRSAKKFHDVFDGKSFPRVELVYELAQHLYRGDEAVAEDVVRRRARPVEGGRMELLFRPGVSALFGVLAAADDATEALRRVTVPVLDLRADPSQRSAARGPVVPPSRLVLVPDAGHTIHRTHPEAFVREVVAFLDEVRQGQAMRSLRDNIADAGTTPDEASRRAGLLPRGAALVTGSGDLARSGITHVVHAATGSSMRTGGAFDPTLESIATSVRNSLALAQRVGGRRVALPFLGGKIFLDRIGATPETLASTIVDAALEARGDLELRFVLFSEEEAELFRSLLALRNAPPAVAALRGDIVAHAEHGADVIVNAANTEVRFGNGVSGAIGRATGAAASLDREAAEAIAAYYGDARPGP